HREREKIFGAPLKRQRKTDEERRLVGAGDLVDDVRQIVLAVERDQLGAKSRCRQRRREVAQAQVLLELGPDQGNPRHRGTSFGVSILTRRARRRSTNDQAESRVDCFVPICALHKSHSFSTASCWLNLQGFSLRSTKKTPLRPSTSGLDASQIAVSAPSL